MMDNQEKPKWYYQTWSLVVSFLCVGPFMLPLVWKNPRFSKKSKIIISVIAVILTYLLYKLMEQSLKAVISYYPL